MAGSLSDLANTVKNDKRVLLLDCSDVVSKKQSRRNFTNIEQLAETIRQEGQIQPIRVMPKNSEGKYVILQGERRWRACSLLGIKVEAIAHKAEQDEVSSLASELIENIQREDLEPKEIANSLNNFVSWGLGQKAIAERIGKSESYVSAHLSLLKLPECVERLYNEGLVRDTETLNNLRQLYKFDPASAEAACKDADTNPITRVQSREFLKVAKKAKKGLGDQRKEKPETSARAAGTPAASKKKGATHSSGDEGGKTTGTSTQPANVHSNGQGWKSLETGALKITVVVHQDDGSEISGYILNDRVDDDSEYVWIMPLVGGSGTAQRTHIGRIRITSAVE